MSRRESLDLNDAIKFCEWLSAKEGRKYRLPTEAEWELACRCGSTGRWSFGDDVKLVHRYDNVGGVIRLG